MREEIMETVQIPLAALESPEYAALPLGDRMFLVDLYIVMNDVERFTIDLNRPEDYRQSKGVWMPRRIKSLINAGFLILDGWQEKHPGNFCRVFRFRYPAIEPQLEAA